MSYIATLLALPLRIWLPLLLSVTVPLVCAGGVLLLDRYRPMGIAATLTARGVALLGAGFTVVTSVATVSVMHTGLGELQGRHVLETVSLAELLGHGVPLGAASRMESAEIHTRLTLYYAARPGVGFVAYLPSPCIGACGLVVSRPGTGARVARWLRRQGAFEADVTDRTLTVAGVPYLAVVSAVRDPDGAPTGRVVVGIEADRVVANAERTAWTLVLLAYGLLALAAWRAQALLAASVAGRVRTLITQLDETPADGGSGRPRHSRDELSLLAESLGEHITRSIERQHASDERFRRLVESSPDAILVYHDDAIVFVNAACVRLVGAEDAADVVRRPLQSLLTLAGPSGTATPPALPGPDRALPIREGALRRVDGRMVDVEVAEIPLAYAGSSAVQAVLRDVSDRKRAEEALRRSEASYRALVENATYGMYRTDRAGRFVAVNPALVRMLGYPSPSALIAADITVDVYARSAECAGLLERFRAAGPAEPVEVEWRRRDGGQIVVRLSGQPVRDEAGEVDGFEVMAEDVTERRTLEAQLRQAQKMDAIGRLTGGVAHDFNNLLTIILANADLVWGRLPDDMHAARGELDDLRAAARRGAALVRKLLAFSRSTKLELEPVRMAGLLGEMSSMLRRLLPEHINFVMPPDGDTGIVLADSGALEQIVLNLATNARDAMPAGGVLLIETSYRQIDEAYCAAQGWGEPGRYFCMAVRDTGHGMDAATRARIFEPFFTTKSPESGTGLGLAIVYGLVRHHRGYVEVDSEVGVGTVVRILLPAMGREVERRAVPRTAGIARGGSEVILLVEDEEPIRRATQKALARYGYTVLLAADGVEALAIIRSDEHSIDLVISDLMMPRMGGKMLFDTLAAEGWRLPFLFISGYSSDSIGGIRQLGDPAGMLNKPWELGELIAKVRETLDGMAARRGSGMAAEEVPKI